MLAYERATLRLVAVSDSLVAKYGYGREQLLGMTLPDLFASDQQARLAAFIDTNVRDERPGRIASAECWRQRYKDGTIIEVDITGDDLEIDGLSCRLLHFQDVTAHNGTLAELRQARELLSASEAHYRLLFDQNPIPVVAYDRATLEIVAANHATIAVYGYSMEELLSMTVKELRPPEDVDSYLAYLEGVKGQRRIGFLGDQPHRHQYKDGTIIDVEVTGDDVILDGRECRLALCVDVTLTEQLSQSGEHMLAIVNDILDISKIETGRLELDITDFDLHEAIEQTCSGPRFEAMAKGLRLDVEIAAEVPRLMRGDCRRIQQVLLNLVANAVKFTARGGVRVRVGARSARDGDRRVRFEVSDTGIGLDPASLELMFEPFTQADVSTTRHYGGTGLGLAIAQELVTLMSGTIGAESRRPARQHVLVRAGSAKRSTAIDGVADNQEARPAAPLWTRSPLVLIAEDSPVNQIVAIRALQRCGCRVHVVSDGREALNALSTRLSTLF